MDRFRGLRRTFANAVVRKIAYVLVAAALAWLGMDQAHAGKNGCGPDGSCNEGQAYSACMAHAGSLPSTGGYVYPHCGRGVSGSFSTFTARRCNDPRGFGYGVCVGDSDNVYYYGAGCSSRPDYVGAPPISTATGKPVPGSISCTNGCTTAWYDNGDGTWTGDATPSSTVCTIDELKNKCSQLGTGWFWNAYAQLCQPPKAECEANQTTDPVTGACKDSCPAGMKLDAQGACEPMEDECPAGNVKAPSGECLPGDGQCAAGEARRANGTCGKDSDGDGEADEDDEDPENDPEKPSASGGDTCTQPPSCSGDAIACMQVKIQWRIDCNTRKSRNVSGGACAAMPVCTGDNCDALEYASLIQQWKAACALEKLAGGGSGDGQGQPAWTRVDGMDQNPGTGETAEDQPQLHEVSLSTDDLDQSGFGGGGSCAAIASAGGGQLSGGFLSAFASPPPMFCQFVGLIKALTILAASVASVYILARGGR